MRKHTAVAVLVAMVVAAGAAQAQDPATAAAVRPVSDVQVATASKGWDALYQRYNANDMSNVGNLYVSFTVEPDGQVSWVRVLSTTVFNQRFVSAVVNQLRITQFPARQVAAVTYPNVSLGYERAANGQPQVTADNADAYVDAMTRVLKEAPAAHPDLAAIYGARMEAYRSKGMLAEASADGVAMLNLAKAKAQVYVARAGIAGKMNQPQLARTDCQQARQHSPANSRAQACSQRLNIMVSAVKTSGAGEVGMP